jgi:hypothetical protein
MNPKHTHTSCSIVTGFLQTPEGAEIERLAGTFAREPRSADEARGASAAMAATSGIHGAAFSQARRTRACIRGSSGRIRHTLSTQYLASDARIACTGESRPVWINQPSVAVRVGDFDGV